MKRKPLQAYMIVYYSTKYYCYEVQKPMYETNIYDMYIYIPVISIDMVESALASLAQL